MDPRELLAALHGASLALKDGKTPDEVNAAIGRFAQQRGYAFSDVDGLKAALKQATADENAADDPGLTTADAFRLEGNGLTFGLEPAIAGLVGAATGKGYEATRAAEVQRIDRLRANHRGLSALFEMLGGAVPAIATGGAAGSGALAGSGSRVLAGLAGGAAGGAGYGALAGVGEGISHEDGLLTTAERAGVGAGTGALVGGGLGALGATVARLFRGGDVPMIARRWLARALKDQGVDPTQIAAKLGQLGDEAVPADLSAGLADEARAAVNLAPALRGEGGPEQAIAQRTAGTSGRVIKAVRQATGDRRNYAQATEEAAAAVKDVRKSGYKTLEQQYPEIPGENVQEALQHPVIRAVARRINPKLIAQNENAVAIEAVMRQFPGVSRDVAAAMVEKAGGAPTGPEAYPSFLEMQKIVKVLRARVRKAAADGDALAFDKFNDAYGVARNALRADVPEYQGVQDAFRFEKRAQNALPAGRKLWGKPVPDIAEALAAEPDKAQGNLRLGMRTALEGRLGKRGSGGATAGDLLNAGPGQYGGLAKIRLLVSDPQKFDELMTAMARERAYARTGVRVRGNSTTARQVGDMAEAIPIPTRHDVLRLGLRRFLGTSGAKRAAAERVGNALLRPEGPDLIAQILATRGQSPSAIAGGLFALPAAQYASQGGLLDF